jgi:hypothetical protein
VTLWPFDVSTMPRVEEVFEMDLADVSLSGCCEDFDGMMATGRCRYSHFSLGLHVVSGLTMAIVSTPWSFWPSARRICT